MFTETHRDRDRDAVLSVLSDPHARAVCQYFQSRGTEVVSLDDLVGSVSERGGQDVEHLEIHLHHVALPKLADVGVVDYEPGTNTVVYRGPEVLERLDEVLADASEVPA